MSFSKFLRIFIAVLAIAAVAISQGFYFITSQKIEKLNNVKPRADVMFLEWAAQNKCPEEPQNCEAYSKQFNGWLLEFEKYKQRKEQSQEFQLYFSLKDLDKEYTEGFDIDGLLPPYISPVLTAGNLLLLIVSFIIVALLGRESNGLPKKKLKKQGSRLRLSPEDRAELMSESKSSSKGKPDIQALIKKATDCAESNPAQAISYLEQAIDGSISSNLSMPALLLCGSLRIKNKIGESQGREQLQKVIGASPQSSEAEEAKKVLETFK